MEEEDQGKMTYLGSSGNWSLRWRRKWWWW